MRSTLRRRLRRWRRNGTTPARGRAWKPGIALSALVLALAATPAFAAGPPWSPPRELSGAGSAPLNLGAAAGIGPTGQAIVLWHSAAGVEAVERAVGHSFGKPRAIPDSKLSMPDLRPSLAFDAKGAALAVWSYFEPHPRFVQEGYAVDYTFGLRAASRGRSGGFGSTQTLTDKLDADPSADVAFDPHGDAVVIWTDDTGMHAAARSAGRHRFGPAQVIGQTQADPQVTVGASGSATAAWAARAHGTWQVGATASDSGAAFGSAVTLKIPGLGDAKPVIGVDGRSAVTAAWSTRGRVMAATCSASGRCGQAHALSSGHETAIDPQVAVAPDGSAVVAWKSPDGISAALRPEHRSFRPAARLASLDAGQTPGDLAVAIGPGGDAATLWTVHAAGGDVVQASLRHGAHARFTKASVLTPSVAGAKWSDPQIVLDAHGNAIAVWGALVDGSPSIQAASYDAHD